MLAFFLIDLLIHTEFTSKETQKDGTWNFCHSFKVKGEAKELSILNVYARNKQSMMIKA